MNYFVKLCLAVGLMGTSNYLVADEWKKPFPRDRNTTVCQEKSTGWVFMHTQWQGGASLRELTKIWSRGELVFENDTLNGDSLAKTVSLVWAGDNLNFANERVTELYVDSSFYRPAIIHNASDKAKILFDGHLHCRQRSTLANKIPNNRPDGSATKKE